MTTSLTSTGLTDPENDDQVDLYTLKYMASNARHLALECLRGAFDEAGITNATLSKRLNWDRSRISRLLNTPSNMTMETLGEMLFAIDGSAPVFTCNKPLDEKPSNSYSVRADASTVVITGASSQRWSTHSSAKETIKVTSGTSQEND